MRIFFDVSAVDQVTCCNYKVRLLRQSQDRINTPLEHCRAVNDTAR